MSKNPFQDIINIKTVKTPNTVKPVEKEVTPEPILSTREPIQNPSVNQSNSYHQDEDAYPTPTIPKREKPWFSQVENKFTTSHNTVVQSRVASVSSGGGSKFKLWFVALVCVLGLLFVLSFIFAKAKVAVNPKTQDVSLDQTFSATKDSTTSALPFTLVVISGEQQKIVTNPVAKDTAKAATGKAYLYNNFSNAPQKLLIDTRLEGSNGKLYKTKTATTVPGKSKTGTPGKVEVEIYADVAGVESNSGPLDFTIFGFKGTPKYSKFYGRSEGSISGGQKGKYYVVPDDQKENLKTELTNALSAQLLKKATDQIPPGFILFKDAIFLNTEEDDISTASSASPATLSVNMKGALSGFLLDEKKLTAEIAKKVVAKYDGSQVHIPDIKNLVFTLANNDVVSFSTVQNINFDLSGPAKVVWDVDSSKLLTDLLGKKKSEFKQILATYPNITSADVTFTPLWAMSFPSKEKNIKIIINEPQ